MCIYIYLTVPGLGCGIWVPSSLIRNWTQAPCTGSVESWPLNHQRSLVNQLFKETHPKKKNNNNNKETHPGDCSVWESVRWFIPSGTNHLFLYQGFEFKCQIISLTIINTILIIFLSPLSFHCLSKSIIVLSPTSSSLKLFRTLLTSSSVPKKGTPALKQLEQTKQRNNEDPLKLFKINHNKGTIPLRLVSPLSLQRAPSSNHKAKRQQAFLPASEKVCQPEV